MKLTLAIGAALLGAIGAPALSQDGADQVMPLESEELAMPVAEVRPPCGTGCLTPVEAVTYAAQLGPRAGIAGKFELTVRAVGERGDMIYLNSEPDYRDRNCLTIALPRALAQRVFGSTRLAEIQQRLVDRKLVVAGVARQVRIDFIVDGQPTGQYYYQVHTRAMNPRQFLVVPPPA